MLFKNNSRSREALKYRFSTPPSTLLGIRSNNITVDPGSRAGMTEGNADPELFPVNVQFARNAGIGALHDDLVSAR